MSEQTFTGIVTQVSEKPWTDRDTNADIILRSFQIDSSKRWFRTGTKEHGLSVDTAVRFTADNRNANVDMSTLETLKESEVERAPKPSGSSAGNSGKRSGGSKTSENWEARGEYWANKEKRDIAVVEPRINYSASQRDAVSLISAALANDALSFGAVAKGKKLDMLLDFVDQVTERFVAQRNATGENNE